MLNLCIYHCILWWHSFHKHIFIHTCLAGVVNIFILISDFVIIKFFLLIIELTLQFFIFIGLHSRRLFFFFLGQRTNSLPLSPLHLFKSILLGPKCSCGLWEHCKLPQWGLGRRPSRQTIWCILESKRAAPVAAVFADFLRINVYWLQTVNHDISDIYN